ncbi:MAG: hypothetical protein R3C55_08670 [Parvularculaceae bacterium]
MLVAAAPERGDVDQQKSRIERHSKSLPLRLFRRGAVAVRRRGLERCDTLFKPRHVPRNRVPHEKQEDEENREQRQSEQAGERACP